MNIEQTKDIEIFIIDFIQDNTQIEHTQINSSLDIVETELLDSFSILSLIMTLESEFSIKFHTEELADKSIKVISSLSQLVFDKINHQTNS
jgi:acyl carrier protein